MKAFYLYKYYIIDSFFVTIINKTIIFWYMRNILQPPKLSQNLSLLTLKIFKIFYIIDFKSVHNYLYAILYIYIYIYMLKQDVSKDLKL